MTRARWRDRIRPTFGLSGLVLVVALAGCSGGNPATSPSGSPATSDTATSTPSAGSATPLGTPTPGSTPASPGDTSSPSGTPASPGGSLTPGGPVGSVSASPLSCTTLLPRRLGRVTVDTPRTTEVSTVVSDGRMLTPGTSQQTDFSDPRLVGPEGGVITDANTIALAVDLVQTGRTKVLLTRPESPQGKADVGRHPFDSPGTYALYNASGQMTADVVALCSGQEQTWEFQAEANPVSGVVNCAVEPGRSNALARSVYQTSC